MAATNTTITVRPAEEGHIIADVTFYDEDGAAVVPNAITWTLTDEDGNVINSRLDVPVATPASSISILVSGDDLAVPDATDLVRKLLVEWTYDSSLGTDIPAKTQATFTIEALPGVS